MSLIHHILAAVAYALVAIVAAVGLPRLVPGLGTSGGFMIGIALLAVSALLHEVFARQDGEGRQRHRLRELRGDYDETRRHMNRLLDTVEKMQQDFRTAVEDGTKARSASGKDVDEVIAEVKVLQGLIERLSNAHVPAEAVAMQAAGGGASLVPAVRSQPVAALATAAAADAAYDLVVPGGLDDQGAGAQAFVLPPVARDLDDLGILNVVKEGLRNNRVDLVLQPIVSLPQRRLKYYETFTRIRDDQGHMVVPEQYIAIAEREGLIAAIDNMLLFRCVQLVRKSQAKAHNLGFFCNISAHSLADRHFFRDFIEFVADNVALAPNLVFEFAHSTIANRDSDIEDLLNYLATQGFRFSMDQVTGLNLDYGALAAQHIKYVKFDAATLIEELRNPSANLAVEDIKRMIDRNGIDLIVEKIESEQMLLELLDLKIDFGQGYLFGEPRLTRD